MGTARLALRPPADSDVPRIVAGCSDPEVTRYIPTIPVPSAEECALAITEPHGTRQAIRFER